VKALAVATKKVQKPLVAAIRKVALTTAKKAKRTAVATKTARRIAAAIRKAMPKTRMPKHPVAATKRQRALVAKAPAVERKSNEPFLRTLQIKPAPCAGFFVIYLPL